MTNLEELKETEEHLKQAILSVNGLMGSFDTLNAMLAVYIPSIAKSLAVIADNMSEEDKEEQNG